MLIVLAELDDMRLKKNSVLLHAALLGFFTLLSTFTESLSDIFLLADASTI